MPARARLKSLCCAALLGAAGLAVGAAQSPQAESASISATTEAAPGISLPVTGLVWILNTSAAKPELSRLYVHSAAVNMHRGANFAREALGSFFVDAKVTNDLPGIAATIRTDSRTPVLFVRKTTDEQEADDSHSAGQQPVNQYHPVLLQLQVAGPNRVVFGFTANQIAGKPKLVAKEIPALIEQIASGQWRKITPRQPLADGEYALTFEDAASTAVGVDVYDFGVGPVQPAKKH